MFLFNWIGYRIFVAHIENESIARLEAQLDNNNYDDAQLISIKVPITHLAYYNSSAIFERADGQIQSGGITYKYVKRRLYNDSLEVLCIPDNAAMQLNTAKNEFFKLVNDLQSNNQNKKTGSHKDFHKNFSTDNYAVNDFFGLNYLSFTISKCFSGYSENLISSCDRIDERPPDFLS